METETTVAFEAALVRRSAAGDAAALTDLVNRYRHPLYARIRRIVGDHHVADELLQETFIRLWKHAGSLDPTRSPGAWLMTVATRLALSFLRRRKRERPTVTMDEALLAAPPTVVAVEEEGALRLKRVREAMDAMDGVHREALQLRVQQKLSYKQMAECWGCSIGTVMSRLHRARMALRASLGESI
jgi:RNA polymerase sigma-70 factor (ECF subfamily)